MSGCAAVGCTNRGDKGYFMKSFPRDPERRALWASQMNRDNWRPNNNSRLCEVHFDNNQWEKTRQDGTRKLKCNAVPTLFDYCSRKTVKRKPLKPKFIVSLKADDPPENYKDSNEVGKHGERENLLSPDSENKSKTEEISVNFERSVLRRNAILDETEDIEKEESESEGNSCRLSNPDSDIRGVKCSAKNCNSYYEAGESNSKFYEFPSGDSKLLEKLLRICHSDFKPGANFICRKHFTSDPDKVGSLSQLETNSISTSYSDEIRSSDLKAEEIETSESLDLQGSAELLNNQNYADGIMNPEDNRCRLCAGENSRTYIPIFGESDLAEKISRCLPIIVLPSDNLPLQICEQCLYNLNISYKLIIESLRADSFLRSESSITKESQSSEEPVENSSEELKENESLPREEPVFRINGPIRCDLCDDFFQDMNMFDTHIETTHLLQWRCSSCDHSFESSQELIAHKTLNHSGQIVACENCTNLDNSGESDCRISEEDLEVDGNTNEDINPDQCSENENDSDCDKETDSKLPDLECTKCKIVFKDAKQFRKHHTIHLPRRIKCSVCFKRCPSVFDYLTHVRIVHNQIKMNNLNQRSTVHGCKYCKKVFLNKQQLIVHLREHKKEMFDDPSVIVYKCVTCPKKFVDRALYQKHRNVHDPACWHKFRCYICNKSFMDKFKLKIHQSIHDGVKPYQCDVCGRMFNRNANMIRHRAKHFEQSCRHCEKIFTNTQSLREHLKDIHGDTLNPRNNSNGVKARGDKRNNGSGDNFICGYCGKQLTSYYSLLDHERIHTGDKPYVCQRCGKAFRSVTARWDHMVRHEKGNYVCELCGKIMSNKLNLSSHLRKHAAIEQRRFECKECGKLFHVRWRLNAHLVRIHHSPAASN